MTGPSSIPRLTDIIEAIGLIRAEMVGVTLRAFEPDKRKRWLVERGIEIISEASRHLTGELKTRHSEVPWPKVAGIGNVLRHDYERVAYDVLWHVVRDDLPLLEKVCREELSTEIARERE
ncbi:MAG: HepT-like ribonuclease domain-containing protein [Acetobacteraceae bacterium]